MFSYSLAPQVAEVFVDCMHSCFGFSPAGHVISSTLEHAAVFQTLKELQAAGVDVSFLEGGAWGAVTADAVQKAITPSTRLISLMAVNNETGVLTDIDKRGRACIRHN